RPIALTWCMCRTASVRIACVAKQRLCTADKNIIWLTCPCRCNSLLSKGISYLKQYSTKKVMKSDANFLLQLESVNIGLVGVSVLMQNLYFRSFSAKYIGSLFE